MKKKMKQQAGQDGQDGASATTTSLPAPEPMATALDEDTPMLDSDNNDEEEEVRSKLDHTPLGAAGAVPNAAIMEQNEEEASQEEDSSKPNPPPSKSKLKYCDNCGNELLTRIQVCAGCKKVAYCNFRCQKASWKMHKKTCSYALRKDGKESTG